MPPVFKASDFLHPLDLSARQQLESVPLLQKAVQKYRNLIGDKRTRQYLLSNALRLGPRQLPDYYRLLPPICDAFGIPEPDLYLMPGSANAWTAGHSRTAIVIHGGLLESMDHEEVTAVLAHECGHILAEHVLYRQMAESLMGIGGFAGLLGAPAAKFVTTVSVPLQLALLSWYRKSELTADRAAAGYLRNAEPMQRALFRFLGAPKLWPGTISYAEFAAQAEDYEAEVRRGTVDRLVALRLEATTTHPNPPMRIKELSAWSQTPAFESLCGIASAHGLDDRRGCLQCGHEIKPGWRYCQVCGAPAGRAALESEE